MASAERRLVAQAVRSFVQRMDDGGMRLHTLSRAIELRNLLELALSVLEVGTAPLEVPWKVVGQMRLYLPGAEWEYLTLDEHYQRVWVHCPAHHICRSCFRYRYSLPA